VLQNKCLNAGQVCLAPDYVLVHRDIKDALVRSLKETLARFYGATPQSSNDFGRIINVRHFDRIKHLLDTCGGHIVYGGDSDALSKYISPTLIENPDTSSAIMQDEIFGK
jgi:aldehyde dehydrogenase (NAD+)